MGKLLIIIGAVLVVIGFLVSYLRLPLGRLPGDISVQGEHFQFYFPIVTCLIISVILSLLFWLFSR